MGVKGVLRTVGEAHVGFWCPGCEEMHVVRVKASDPGNVPGGMGPIWRFNDDYDKPTLDPSVNIRTGHYVPGVNGKDSCWCDFNKDLPEEDKLFGCGQCHFFLRDGILHFLGDCTHALAGLKVPLIVPDESRYE